MEPPKVRRRWAAPAALGVLLLCAVLVAGPAQGSSSGLVISEVYGGGRTSTAVYKQDFVELFNPGAASVSLDGWSIQYGSATGDFSRMTVLPDASIAPGRRFLVQESSGEVGASIPTPDATGTIQLSSIAGKVALSSSTTLLPCGSDPCSSAAIVDLVGYGGTASFSEGSPAPSPGTTMSVQRAGNGCVDTGDNASDFAAASPTPLNGAAGASPCSTSAPRLSVGDVRVVEGEAGRRRAIFTIALSRSAVTDVGVHLATADGTASAVENDYVSKSISLTIPAGRVWIARSVEVIGDRRDEPVESFVVRLSAPSGAVLGRATGTATVLDDDPRTGLRVAVGDAGLVEGDTGSRTLKVPVTLSRPSLTTASVHYAIDCASSCSDTTGVVSFGPGAISRRIDVVVAADAVDEPNEVLTIALTSATGARIGRANGAGTIIDDDPGP